jgi:hypothetical protein
VLLGDGSSRSCKSRSSDAVKSREICGATVLGPMDSRRIAAADEAGPTQTDAMLEGSYVSSSRLRKQAWTTMYGDVCGKLRMELCEIRLGDGCRSRCRNRNEIDAIQTASK